MQAKRLYSAKISLALWLVRFSRYEDDPLKIRRKKRTMLSPRTDRTRGRALIGRGASVAPGAVDGDVEVDACGDVSGGRSCWSRARKFVVNSSNILFETSLIILAPSWATSPTTLTSDNVTTSVLPSERARIFPIIFIEALPFPLTYWPLPP